MDETWHTSSTFKADEDKKQFQTLLTYKLMKYAKFHPYWILKNREIPSQNEPKTQFWGQKWSILGPKMS